MQIDKLFVGVLVFVVVLISGTMVLTGVSNQYDDVDLVDSRLSLLHNDSITLSNEMDDDTQNMTSNIFSTFFGVTDFASFMFGGAFNALNTLISLPNTLFGFMNTIGTELNIPKIFINIAQTALFLMILFAIIFIIFRIKA